MLNSFRNQSSMQDKHPPIIVEEHFDASRDIVWQAIVDQAEMVQWYFEDIPSFRAEVGFETNFGVHSGERLFTHLWKVTEVVTLEKITYSWKYKEYSGDASVSWVLSEEDQKTTLRLICRGIESFPQDIPEFTRESCLAGWQFFIQERLKKYLENKN